MMAERRSRLLQAELEQLKVSREMWSKKVEQLKEVLDESKLQFAALEEAIDKQLQKREKLQRRELLKECRRDGWRHQLHAIDEGCERELEELQQAFNREKDAMRLKLLLQEEQLKKQLEEEQHKYEELVEKEESMKQQLLDKEEVNRLLTEVCQQWESSAQQWAQKQRELKEQPQQSRRGAEDPDGL